MQHSARHHRSEVANSSRATAAIIAEVRIGTPRNDLAASYAFATADEQAGHERPDWTAIHMALASILSREEIRILRFRAQLILAGLIVPAPTGLRRVTAEGARLQ